ncbi:MAG: hypothetical protein QNJ37_02930 [Crocosphaera sp.]|nr:hypothetical protein [Crocosphaera sp.]
MKESQIQSILETLIKEDKFYDRINNIDQIQERYESWYKEDYIPSFSIDDLSTRKLLCAANNVLSSLESVEIITTASQNISVDRQERLFPDLILFNQYQEKIILIELKRSKKTARETLTEMLAYEHEVRNFLPFLSNFEILFCIVSTEYPNLLSHSITNLTTWESKQILCLKVQESEDKELSFEVYIPSAWFSLNTNGFPPDAISTFKIILYKHFEDEISPDAEAAVSYAASLITKEGDRNNSHGFVLIWRDCWNLEDVTGAVEYQLMIGLINPYAFLPFAQSLGVIDASQSPFGQYFLDNEDYLSSPCFNEKIVEKGLIFLEKFFRVDIEGFSTWTEERLQPHKVINPMCLMYHRALPLKVELWGALGDFSRELIVHPGFNKHILSGISGSVFGCENPLIAIPLIDEIAGIRKIDGRGFTCSMMFELGVLLGALGSFYYTAMECEENNLRNLPASITWKILEITPFLQEFMGQYGASQELNVPPPPLKSRPYNNFEEALESVQSLVDWIIKDFLGERREIHLECFVIGLTIYPLMDEYFWCHLSEAKKASITKEIIESSTKLIKWITKQCLSNYTSTEYIQNILETLANKYFNCEVISITKDSVSSLVNKISDNKHCDLCYDVLMDLLDQLIIPINYRTSPSHTLSEYNYLDWYFLREEILRLYERGFEFPALIVNNRGEINIVDISEEIYSSPLKIDFRHQFVFVTSSNGIDMALVRNWDEIIN